MNNQIHVQLVRRSMHEGLSYITCIIRNRVDENRKRVQPRKAPMIDMSDDENTGERTQI